MLADPVLSAAARATSGAGTGAADLIARLGDRIATQARHAG